MCNSCEVEEKTATYGNYTWTYSCPIYDCDNTDYPATPDTCYGSTVDLWSKIWYDPLPCENSCSLCANFDDNAYGYFNMTGFNYTVGCWSLQWAAITGGEWYFPAGECSTVQEIFDENCVCTPLAGEGRALHSSSSNTQAEAVAARHSTPKLRAGVVG